VRRDASCSCGQLRVTVEGDPVRLSMCHCLDCQKRTGSTYGIQARFAKDGTVIEGRSKEWVRTADSGKTIAFHFCPDCGSTVFWEQDTMPNLVAVAVGAFADPTFPAPKLSVYETRKHPWVSTPEACEHWD